MSATLPLPNPEGAWPRRPVAATHADIERWLGEPISTYEVLSGGNSNVNARVGNRVVRGYRRRPSPAPMEARLIAYPWRTFRVPRVLRSGPDFAVLEYVDHGPVLGTVDHGRAVGAALAEIHSVPFAGVVDDAPFPDLVGALLGYATSELEKARVAIGDRARTVLEAIAPQMREIAGPTVLLHGDFKASNLHWAGDRLLVLDWEFAYPGSALSDIGQLLRWSPPVEFVEGFVATYGPLPADWQRWSSAFDLVNLAGVLANMSELDHGQRITDVTERIEKTLALFEARDSA